MPLLKTCISISVLIPRPPLVELPLVPAGLTCNITKNRGRNMETRRSMVAILLLTTALVLLIFVIMMESERRLYRRSRRTILLGKAPIIITSPKIVYNRNEKESKN